MTDKHTWLNRWPANLAALAAGLLLPLAQAPFNIWPLAIVSFALFALLLHHCHSPRQSAWRGWWYGAGMFGFGTSWIYVSIHVHGNASPILAGLMTAIFCLGLALLPALLGYLYGRWLKHASWSMCAGLPAIWILFEWIRSWLLTGFPWLYLGYGFESSWLAGWFPVFGIYGAGFIVALTATSIATALLRWDRQAPLPQQLLQLNPLIIPLAFWLAGFGLQQVSWTHVKSEPLQVALVQANIPQEKKWRPEFFGPSLRQYRQLSKPLWSEADILIWPETAIARLYSRSRSLLTMMQREAKKSDTTFITGIPTRVEGGGFYNTLVALDEQETLYHKRYLVPFGEFVPLEQMLRGLITFFNLPMSSFVSGPEDIEPLIAGAYKIAPFICYEIVYPDLVAREAANSDILLTVSNDTWFGDSIGPIQHLQIAQTRALETGRYLIRATNNGVTAIIDHKGQITAQLPQFVADTLIAPVTPMQGKTPYSQWRSWPIIGICSLLCLALLLPTGSRQQAGAVC